MQENKNIKNLSYKPLILVLYTSIFIIIPLVAWWAISTPDFKNQIILNKIIIYLVPTCWIIFFILLNIVLIYFKIMDLKSINWVVPFSFTFWITIVSYEILNKYFRVTLIILVIFLFIILSNIIVYKILDKKEIKNYLNK